MKYELQRLETITKKRGGEQRGVSVFFQDRWRGVALSDDKQALERIIPNNSIQYRIVERA